MTPDGTDPRRTPPAGPSGPDSRVSHPTLAQVRAAAERVHGETFTADWVRLCARLDVDADAHDLDDASFERVLVGLEELDPLSRVIATSWRIRRTAARKLAELGR